jgi:hypothetical protein
MISNFARLSNEMRNLENSSDLVIPEGSYYFVCIKNTKMSAKRMLQDTPAPFACYQFQNTILLLFSSDNNHLERSHAKIISYYTSHTAADECSLVIVSSYTHVLTYLSYTIYCNYLHHLRNVLDIVNGNETREELEEKFQAGEIESMDKGEKYGIIRVARNNRVKKWSDLVDARDFKKLQKFIFG